MSSSFKKLLPIFIIVVLLAGGYLLYNLTEGVLMPSTSSVSVAEDAREFQMRLQFLAGTVDFVKLSEDARYSQLIDIYRKPASEAQGRDNPFVR